MEETYCQRVADGRLPELIANAQENTEALKLAATTALPVGAHLSVPIRLNGAEVFGTLCCFSRTPNHSFTHKDIQTLHLHADFVGRALSATLAQEHQMNQAHERVLDVLEHQRFRSVYQPILDLLSHRPIGYEMLTRFTTEPVRSPDKWFEEAGAVGLLQDLEIAVIRKALGDFGSFAQDTYLSFNVSPQTILAKAVSTVFEGYPLERVVLEMTEHESVDDHDLIAKELAPLREQGLRLAVDDAGAGYASFRHILKLKPDLIKLDASLVAKIDEEIGARALAAAIVKFAAETGTCVVAEGVETAKELEVLKSLNVKLAQGFLLGRPDTFENLFLAAPP